MGVALSSVCPLSSSTPHGHHTVGLPSTTTSHFFAPIEHCRSGRCPLPSHAPPRFLAAAQLSFSPGRRRGGCLLSQSIPSPQETPSNNPFFLPRLLTSRMHTYSLCISYIHFPRGILHASLLVRRRRSPRRQLDQSLLCYPGRYTSHCFSNNFFSPAQTLSTTPLPSPPSS